MPTVGIVGGSVSSREFVLSETDHARLLVLAGRLDVVAAADVRTALALAVDAGSGDLTVDLAAVEGIDATGLGVLVGAHRRAGRAGRRLVLRDVPPAVARVLLVTRLDKVLHQSHTHVLA